MRNCKICQKPITDAQTYCKKCLNDPTPVRLMKAGLADDRLLPRKEVKKRTIKSASLIVGAWALGFLVVAIIVVRWAVLDSDPDKSAAVTSIKTVHQIPVVKPPITESEKALSLDSQKPLSNPSAATHILQNFAASLTEQYSSNTPYEVKVTGDDISGSLRFDCSDDPNPEDVCFMLYKRYPDSREETNLLRTMGVRNLYFDSGLMKKGWEKTL